MKKYLLIITAAMAAFTLSARDWTPAGDHIRTEWAEKIDPSNPLPEYPRPQMVRTRWQNLNGLWNYSIQPADEETMTPQGQILVPYPVESALSGVCKNVGEGNELWYERTFTVPRDWKGNDILLHFGAVDWKAEVFVNGHSAGVHTGGYAPFTFDITPFLNKSGKQVLRVKVWDPTDNSYIPRGKQVNAPKGIWYTPVTGIWQTVWMEPVPAARVVSYNPVSDIASGNITFSIAAEGSLAGDVVTAYVLEGGEGYDPVKPSQKVLASAVAVEGSAVVTVPSPVLWSPDAPYLYGVRITIERDGKVIDEVNGYTAMRKISEIKYPIGDRNYNTYKRLALNEQPIFMFGPLDQGWWPDGLYTAPTDEALKFDIAKTKDFGFNMIRKHIKVEPARWYYWCDVLGMCVWQDMPCIGDHDIRRAGRDSSVVAINSNHWAYDSFIGGTEANIPPQWRLNYFKEWGEIIRNLKFFQCITVWIPFNEAWGQFDTPQVVKFTRSQDDTRLINESSGGNYFLAGDIVDVHHYPCPAMNAFEATKVNVLGEYGGIGLPVEGHLWNPESFWGYNKLLADGGEVLDLYSRFAEMLKVFVSTGCSAAVYTQTTDVELEINGLMTYDRKVIKMDEAKLREVNRSVIESLK